MHLVHYLNTLEKNSQWNADTVYSIRKKSYQFMLRDEVLWSQQKKKSHILLRIIDTNKEKSKILQNLHDFDIADHKGGETIYERVKKVYWWPSMYVDVGEYVKTCKVCQLYSKVKHRDGLVPRWLS